MRATVGRGALDPAADDPVSKVTKLADQVELAAARERVSRVIIPPPAPAAAPGFSPRFTREGLDSLIDIVVKKSVASIRAREAAQRRTSD
jgi:hypothetical protein